MKVNRLIIALLLIVVPIGMYGQSKQKSHITENKAINIVMKIPEVQALSRSIEKNTNDKHGVAAMVTNQDTKEYHISVGYDGGDAFETSYLFNVNKKLGTITVDNQESGRTFPLKEWQRRNKRYEDGDEKTFDD